MKAEIKTAVEDLVASVLNSVGDQVKGVVPDTREEIITKNVNIALMKINHSLKLMRSNIVVKMKGKSGEKSLISVLNEEF